MRVVAASCDTMNYDMTKIRRKTEAKSNPLLRKHPREKFFNLNPGHSWSLSKIYFHNCEKLFKFCKIFQLGFSSSYFLFGRICDIRIYVEGAS